MMMMVTNAALSTMNRLAHWLVSIPAVAKCCRWRQAMVTNYLPQRLTSSLLAWQLVCWCLEVCTACCHCICDHGFLPSFISGLPVTAEGNLIGYINNVDIVDSTIVATVTPGESGTRVIGTIRNVPPEAGMRLTDCLSVCLSVGLSVCLSACLCICILYCS